MPEPLHGEVRRFRSAEEVWPAVALLIEELDCTDRCVEYSIEGAVQSYDRVRSWLTDTIESGRDNIRYSVDPDHVGLVRVDFSALTSGPA